MMMMMIMMMMKMNTTIAKHFIYYVIHITLYNYTSNIQLYMHP